MTLLPFAAPPAPPNHRTLPGGAWLAYENVFLNRTSADALLRVVLDRVSFEQRSIFLFGREVLQPRLVGWAGEVPYRYSGQTLEPRRLEPELTWLLERVREHVGVPFNHILFNRYRNGQDAMGMHSDDEPELGDEPVLASLSLGAARRFVIAARDKADTSTGKLELELSHGSLLTMGGAMQHLYRHGVPRQRGVTGERINLTFRHILTIPRS